MWVAAECLERFRDEHNLPDDVPGWVQLAEKLGMVVEWRHLPFGIHAFRIKHLVSINFGLTEAEELHALQHEVSHWVMHRGNSLWWANRPMGEMILAKHERQANEFAMLVAEVE